MFFLGGIVIEKQNGLFLKFKKTTTQKPCLVCFNYEQKIYIVYVLESSKTSCSFHIFDDHY